MKQIWITKTSDKNLQIRQQDLLDDIERLYLKLEDNKLLLNEYNDELKKRGLIKAEAETSKQSALNIADVSGSFPSDNEIEDEIEKQYILVEGIDYVNGLNLGFKQGVEWIKNLLFK